MKNIYNKKKRNKRRKKKRKKKKGYKSKNYYKHKKNLIKIVINYFKINKITSYLVINLIIYKKKKKNQIWNRKHKKF